MNVLIGIDLVLNIQLIISVTESSIIFSKGLCKNVNYSIQSIEKLEGDERTKRNALNSQKTSLRHGRPT